MAFDPAAQAQPQVLPALFEPSELPSVITPAAFSPALFEKFELPQEDEIPAFPAMAEAFSVSVERLRYHIGDESTFACRSDLRCYIGALYLIITDENTADGEKELIRTKVIEGSDPCTTGLMERVTSYFEGKLNPQSLLQLLAVYRKEIMHRAAVKRGVSDIHVFTRFRMRANAVGLNIPFEGMSHTFLGGMGNAEIESLIKQQFVLHFRLDRLLPKLFKPSLARFGYCGEKTEEYGYANPKYVEIPLKIAAFLKRAFGSEEAVSEEEIRRYFGCQYDEDDGDIEAIVDINWQRLISDTVDHLSRQSFLDLSRLQPVKIASFGMPTAGLGGGGGGGAKELEESAYDLSILVDAEASAAGQPQRLLSALFLLEVDQAGEKIAYRFPVRNAHLFQEFFTPAVMAAIATSEGLDEETIQAIYFQFFLQGFELPAVGADLINQQIGEFSDLHDVLALECVSGEQIDIIFDTLGPVRLQTLIPDRLKLITALQYLKFAQCEKLLTACDWHYFASVGEVREALRMLVPEQCKALLGLFEMEALQAFTPDVVSFCHLANELGRSKQEKLLEKISMDYLCQLIGAKVDCQLIGAKVDFARIINCLDIAVLENFMKTMGDERLNQLIGVYISNTLILLLDISKRVRLITALGSEHLEALVKTPAQLASVLSSLPPGGFDAAATAIGVERVCVMIADTADFLWVLFQLKTRGQCDVFLSLFGKRYLAGLSDPCQVFVLCCFILEQGGLNHVAKINQAIAAISAALHSDEDPVPVADQMEQFLTLIPFNSAWDVKTAVQAKLVALIPDVRVLNRVASRVSDDVFRQILEGLGFACFRGITQDGELIGELLDILGVRQIKTMMTFCGARWASKQFDWVFKYSNERQLKKMFSAFSSREVKEFILERMRGESWVERLFWFFWSFDMSRRPIVLAAMRDHLVDILRSRPELVAFHGQTVKNLPYLGRRIDFFEQVLLVCGEQLRSMFFCFEQLENMCNKLSLRQMQGLLTIIGVDWLVEKTSAIDLGRIISSRRFKFVFDFLGKEGIRRIICDWSKLRNYIVSTDQLCGQDFLAIVNQLDYDYTCELIGNVENFQVLLSKITSSRWQERLLCALGPSVEIFVKNVDDLAVVLCAMNVRHELFSGLISSIVRDDIDKLSKLLNVIPSIKVVAVLSLEVIRSRIQDPAFLQALLTRLNSNARNLVDSFLKCKNPEMFASSVIEFENFADFLNLVNADEVKLLGLVFSNQLEILRPLGQIYVDFERCALDGLVMLLRGLNSDQIIAVHDALCIHFNADSNEKLGFMLAIWSQLSEKRFKNLFDVFKAGPPSILAAQIENAGVELLLCRLPVANASYILRYFGIEKIRNSISNREVFMHLDACRQQLVQSFIGDLSVVPSDGYLLEMNEFIVGTSVCQFCNAVNVLEDDRTVHRLLREMNQRLRTIVESRANIFVMAERLTVSRLALVSDTLDGGVGRVITNVVRVRELLDSLKDRAPNERLGILNLFNRDDRIRNLISNEDQLQRVLAGDFSEDQRVSLLTSLGRKKLVQLLRGTRPGRFNQYRREFVLAYKNIREGEAAAAAEVFVRWIRFLPQFMRPAQRTRRQQLVAADGMLFDPNLGAGVSRGLLHDVHRVTAPRALARLLR